MKNRLILASLLLVIILGYLIIRIHNFQSKVFTKTTQASQQDVTLSDHFNHKTSFNILLLGYGGGNHDGAYLTDSMVIVHIDPSKQKTTLISIPRDLWVIIPTNGDSGSHWKINAAYELGLDDVGYPKKQGQFKGQSGAGNLVKYVVGNVTGLTIDRFVAMDFNGFKKAIDSLGGVDLTVEKTFDDFEYPIDGREDDLCGRQPSDLPDLEKISTVSATEAFPCRYEHLHFDQGYQHMDGETALNYVRSRHSLQDGTDFGRSKRQRNLLPAVKNKVLSIGFLPKALPFISSIEDDFRTDLSPSEAKELITQASTLNKYQVNNLALTDQNVLKPTTIDDGQYALLSEDGLDRWSSVRDWLNVSLSNIQSTENPVIKIENGTTIPGLAALARNRLQDRDYNTLTPSNFDGKTQKTTSITVYKPNINPQIINDLKKEFGVDSIKNAQQNDSGYDILITVGENYNLLQGKKLIN